MTQQAELLQKIDTLPPEYFGEVFDFVAYLQQKARREAAMETAPIKRSRMTAAEEAEDVLSYQDIDAVWDNLERLTPNERTAMRDTTVPINLGDIVL